jgi:hypothetical protein
MRTCHCTQQITGIPFCTQFGGLLYLARRLNNQSRQNYNGYDFGYPTNPRGGSTSIRSKVTTPISSRCGLPAGGSTVNDHEEPARPHQFDEMPVFQSRKLEVERPSFRSNAEYIANRPRGTGCSVRAGYHTEPSRTETSDPADSTLAAPWESSHNKFTQGRVGSSISRSQPPKCPLCSAVQFNSILCSGSALQDLFIFWHR